MLSGVILDEGEATPTPATSLSYTTETIDARSRARTLRVTDATGGLEFIPTLPANATGDVYVFFDLTRDDGAGSRASTRRPADDTQTGRFDLSNRREYANVANAIVRTPLAPLAEGTLR